MNVVVAGGTGFIGQKIVSSLLENNHKVFVRIIKILLTQQTSLNIDKQASEL